MADTHELLEILQADVLAVLKATPALELANVIADNEGDIEAKVGKALSTLTETGGKNGLAVVVLLPEIIEAEANIPGPPFVVKVEIRTLENVLINRAAASGSLVRSSQAALSALSALHLRHLGHCLLSAGKDPVAPVEVKKGHVSHAVTLTARFNGFITSKPLGVEAEMESVVSEMEIVGTVLDGSSQPVPFPVQIDTGFLNARPFYQAQDTTSSIFWDGMGSWVLTEATYGDVFKSDSNVATPDLATGWYATASLTGTVSVEAAFSVVQLTCASPSSSIRYTTDGSYPSPAKTLYSAPISGLATGTVVRCAAYVSGQAPGDVLEFTITD